MFAHAFNPEPQAEPIWRQTESTGPKDPTRSRGVTKRLTPPRLASQQRQESILAGATDYPQAMQPDTVEHAPLPVFFHLPDTCPSRHDRDAAASRLQSFFRLPEIL